MPTVRGRDEVKSYIASVPVALENKILRGAARAAAKIVADEAKARSHSDLVAQSVKISTRQDAPGRVIAKVQTKGPGAYLAPWQEYGTEPHFIKVADADRQGMSVGKVNSAVKSGAINIGGDFVTGTVLHPGARPHPFMRPALDTKADAAVAAAQGYINVRVAREGLGGAGVEEE